MSRIDEALKRAAEGAPAEPRKVDPFTLDEYPREDPSRSHHDAPATRDEPDWSDPVLVSARPSYRTAVPEPLAPANDPPPASLAIGPRPVKTSLASASRLARAEPLGGPLRAIRAPAELIRQMQRLAGLLHERQTKQGLKTLAVMSAVEGEGKTTTALGLAVSLSRTHASRVLLIDRALSHPALHEVIGASNDLGLSDLIRGRRQIAPVAVSPLLHVLTAGMSSPEPSEELVADQLRALIEESASRYDWILVDTPAMSQLSQPEVVGHLTDGVVFIVGAATPFPVVQQAIARVGRPRIVGTVLYGIDESPESPEASPDQSF